MVASAMFRAAAMAMVLALSFSTCQAQLSSTFYAERCPNGLSTIRTSIRSAILRERRIEKFVIQNNNSVRGFEVIDQAKSAVENVCPGVVSCADILAVASRDASEYVGGLSWTVRLGRRDSTDASASLASRDLPRFTADLRSLIDLFENKGLTERDMVALSGSHTIGQAQCVTFRDRIYSNGSDTDAGFASTRRQNCSATSPDGNGNLAPLDLVTPNSFENNYFRNLLQRRGLLQSDQALFSGGSTDSIVNEYSRNPSTFSSDFASAMVKMGDIEPLTGSAGIIRRICSRVN
ncbi:Peroxidase 5 [Hibiscus syriacus]|uniref:Peroxidase n=1 Tax=Hibiscus syriacus TaxID=106335 RepID=A0A6A2X8L4_HIBSY|nr:Peroxidase 5 [Hibiscus syriacus]